MNDTTNDALLARLDALEGRCAALESENAALRRTPERAAAGPSSSTPHQRPPSTGTRCS